MATLTGTLKVLDGESELKGKTLARKGATQPLRAATEFLADEGFGDGSQVKVTGEDGKEEGMKVFHITKAEKPEGTAAKRAVKKASKKAAKKSRG